MGFESVRCRFAGIPWTEAEHRLFLLGLQKLGKVRIMPDSRFRSFCWLPAVPYLPPKRSCRRWPTSTGAHFLRARLQGDWRGISRHYVTTRTPTQVASHAQKHFIRQSSLTKRKRRSSLFDITGDGAEMSVRPGNPAPPPGALCVSP